VSDAERDAVADRLRDAAAEGRLDPDELEERVAAAYGARTAGELATVTDDLPAPAEPPKPREPLWKQEDVREMLSGFIIANFVCNTVWLATGADGHYWPIWVWLGTGIGLVATFVHALLGVDQKKHRERHQLPEPPRPPDPPQLPRL
jgi:hypothetical protein